MKQRYKFFATSVAVVFGLALTACGDKTTAVKTTITKEPEASGPWTLNRDESGMTFITIKKGSLAEIGTFTGLDGKIAEDGSAEFTIVLDTVNTNNETRDPRMRQYLFETDKHPYITAKAKLDLGSYVDMEIGERRTTFLAYDLGLHGISDAKESYVMVTRLGANKVLVENKAPVIIDAADFGLEAGVEKLRELANLESIAPTVPVTFSLVFER